MVVWPMAFALAFIGAVKADATPSSLTDISALTKPWLLIGTGAHNDSTTPEGVFNKGIGDAVDVSNFELGANKAPVQVTSDYGPGLAGNVPPLTPGALGPAPLGITPNPPTPQVITFDGNVAVTSIDKFDPMSGKNGTFHFSDVGLFAMNPQAGLPILGIPGSMPGVNCAGPANTDTSNGGCMASNGGSGNPPNSLFNDVNYPNSLNSPTPNVGSDLHRLTGDVAAGGTGPNNGIKGGVGFSDLRMGLDTALTLIPSLSGLAPMFCDLEINNSGIFHNICSGNVLDLDQVIEGSNLGGQVKGGTPSDPTNLYVKLTDGLNIIDIDTGGNDFLLNNANIIIDGSEDARVIFRILNDKNFNINQGNIVIGNMGIGLNNVMFFSDTTQQSATFTFNDAIFNGIAFWTLGDGSGIHVNDSQGCVQMVGDKINLQDVRYSRCGFMEMDVPPIPEPSTVLLLGSGLAGLGLWGRRKNRKD
jgi:hypothetical protein